METNAADKRPGRVSRIPRALPAAEHRADAPATVPGAVSVPIDKIERDPDQPRRDWRHAEGYQRLDELAQSIKEFGLLQPLVVRRVADHYVVIAGGRRLVAARRAGLHEVPVIVRDDEGTRVRVLQLIENLQRQQLSPLDEARAYQEMLEIDALTTGGLAARLHVSTQTVRDKLRLLRDQVLADAVERRQIAATVAREINKLPDDVTGELRKRIQAGEKLQVSDIDEVRAQLAAAGVVNPRWNPRRSDGPPEAPRQERPPARGSCGDGPPEETAPSSPALSPAEQAAAEVLRSCVTPDDDALRSTAHEPAPPSPHGPTAPQTTVAPRQPPDTSVIALPERAEPARPPSALNRVEPATRESGPSLRAILQRLGGAYDVYEEALLYGLERGWSCAGLLQQSRRERDAERDARP
jgi:ParB family transcriptional regulator, chromosome partitioning protein